MRIERNLSQDGLAALMPKRRHLSWVSGIERGLQEPNLSDLHGLSAALQVSMGWLVSGSASGETEFVTRLRGMEPLLDERGQRAVLATAEREVEESKTRADQMAEDESEMLRLFRAASAEERHLLLAAAGQEAPPARRRRTPRQESGTTQERTA